MIHHQKDLFQLLNFEQGDRAIQQYVIIEKFMLWEVILITQNNVKFLYQGQTKQKSSVHVFMKQ